MAGEEPGDSCSRTCEPRSPGPSWGLHPALPPGLQIGPGLLGPLFLLGRTPRCPTLRG